MGYILVENLLNSIGSDGVNFNTFPQSCPKKVKVTSNAVLWPDQ